MNWIRNAWDRLQSRWHPTQQDMEPSDQTSHEKIANTGIDLVGRTFYLETSNPWTTDRVIITDQLRGWVRYRLIDKNGKVNRHSNVFEKEIKNFLLIYKEMP